MKDEKKIMEILEWSITSESKKLMYDFTKILKIDGCIIRKLENVDEKKYIYTLWSQRKYMARTELKAFICKYCHWKGRKIIGLSIF